MSVCSKVTYKKIAVVMLVLFFISLLPIFYCSFFDYATGDDLWEGAAAHRVLVENGSVKEFLRAVFEWAKEDYVSWEGNWSSIILWCLEPSIWGEKVYCITPWIAIFMICSGTFYFIFYYFKKYLSCDSSFPLIFSVIVSFLSIQYMPNVRNGIFWYTGMVNYIVPYGLCLASFAWIDKFVEIGKKRYCVWAAFAFAYLGGAGYTPIVLAFEITVLYIIIKAFVNKGQKLNRIYWVLLPLLLLVIGFIFSAISPGNAVRGGESYQFSIIRIFTTVFECIKQGVFGGIDWVFSVRPLLLLIPILMVVTWEQVDVMRSELEFRHPIFVTILLFLISCSMYAPGIYSQSEVSGGVTDNIYFVFLLVYIFEIIYLTCFLKSWFLKRQYNVGGKRQLEKFRMIIFVGEIIFCLIFGRHLIGNMTDYICITFITSGQLEDFHYQMEERLEILHNPEIIEVVLPEMNNEQGPFMHMALLGDSNAYTNRATARFYGKEFVIAIPRTEYYELYGYPEAYKGK